jgi:hypothetical protein
MAFCIMLRTTRFGSRPRLSAKALRIRGNVNARSGRLGVCDGPFRFHLPATSMNVQHLSEDDQDAPDNEYEGIACPACAKVHFVNRKTGKLLGQDE